MSRIIPFDTSQKCDECGIRGAFDYSGDFLCERCSRQYIDSNIEYDEELDDEYCPCTDCKCGKQEDLIIN